MLLESILWVVKCFRIHHFILSGLTFFYCPRLFTWCILNICPIPGTVLGILHVLPSNIISLFYFIVSLWQRYHCYFTYEEIMAINLLSRTGVTKLFYKETVHIFGFVVHTVTVTTVQLCNHKKGSHEQYKTEWTWLCSKKTVFAKTADRTAHDDKCGKKVYVKADCISGWGTCWGLHTDFLELWPLCLIFPGHSHSRIRKWLADKCGGGILSLYLIRACVSPLSWLSSYNKFVVWGPCSIICFPFLY